MRGLAGRRRALCGAAVTRRLVRALRERTPRGRRSGLALQRAFARLRTFGRRALPGGGAVTARIVSAGALAGLFRNRALRGRLELDARPPRFRESDGHGLLRGPCTVFPLADVVHLFTNEFAGLCGRRLSLALV